MNTNTYTRQTYNYIYKFTNTNIDRSVAQPGAQVPSADPRQARLRQRHRHPGGAWLDNHHYHGKGWKFHINFFIYWKTWITQCWKSQNHNIIVNWPSPRPSWLGLMITQNIIITIINSHHNLMITFIIIMTITQTQLVAALTKILLFGLGSLSSYKNLIKITIIIITITVITIVQL